MAIILSRPRFGFRCRECPLVGLLLTPDAAIGFNFLRIGEKMKTIVINAAPRMTSGNTHLVLSPFVEGLRAAGAQVDLVVLNRMKIERCTGCFTC